MNIEFMSQLAKVSKILAVVEEGSISKWVGKPLDQIDVDVNDGKPNKILGSILRIFETPVTCCSCDDVSKILSNTGLYKNKDDTI